MTNCPLPFSPRLTRQLLGRLAVTPEDTAEIMAGWPDSDSPLRTPGLHWLLDRSIALVRAYLGGHEWLPSGPELPRERGPLAVRSARSLEQVSSSSGRSVVSAHSGHPNS